MIQKMVSLLHFPESLLCLVGIISRAYLASGIIAVVFPRISLPPSAVLGPLCIQKHPRDKLGCASTTVMLICSPFNKHSRAFFTKRPEHKFTNYLL